MSISRHFPVLRVILPAAEWSELHWSAFADDGRYVAQGVAPLAALPGHDALEIILPAKRVSAHLLDLPAQAGKHLDALITQALEDRLLGERADALSWHGPQCGAQRLVWVCSQRWLAGELTRLVDAGLRFDRIFPDYELLVADGEVTPCAQTADGILFRMSNGRMGLVGAPAMIALLPGGQETRQVPDLYRLPTPVACRTRLPASFSRFNKETFDLRLLRRPALLLALCAALALAGSVLHWRQLENREARLRHEIRQTFASAFPGTTIIDPLLQWESKVREQSGATRGDALDDVLSLAARLNAPVHPLRIEARDGWVRLTLTDSEVAQLKTPANGVKPPESSPAEAGLTRLQFGPAR
jgi:general secretion pathway protein L